MEFKLASVFSRALKQFGLHKFAFPAIFFIAKHHDIKAFQVRPQLSGTNCALTLPSPPSMEDKGKGKQIFCAFSTCVRRISAHSSSHEGVQKFPARKKFTVLYSCLYIFNKSKDKLISADKADNFFKNMYQIYQFGPNIL